MESSGLHQQKSMVGISGLQWTPPRLNMPIWPLSHQHIPGFESCGFWEIPAEQVGECKVLIIYVGLEKW
jgi:hypothetical protein